MKYYNSNRLVEKINGHIFEIVNSYISFGLSKRNKNSYLSLPIFLSFQNRRIERERKRMIYYNSNRLVEKINDHIFEIVYIFLLR